MVGRLCSMLAIVGVTLAAPNHAEGQSLPPVRSLAPTKKTSTSDDVPASHKPPAGMCRVWIDNVPPAQQPAPTDCATAIRTRPPNARVIFSEDDPKGRDKADRARREDDKDKARDRRDGKPKRPDG